MGNVTPHATPVAVLELEPNVTPLELVDQVDVALLALELELRAERDPAVDDRERADLEALRRERDRLEDLDDELIKRARWGDR